MTKRTMRRIAFPSGALKSIPWGAVPTAIRKSETFSVRAWGKALPFAIEKGPSFSRSASAALSSGWVTPGVPAAMNCRISSSASSFVRAERPHLMSFPTRRSSDLMRVGGDYSSCMNPLQALLSRDVTPPEDDEGRREKGRDVEERHLQVEQPGLERFVPVLGAADGVLLELVEHVGRVIEKAPPFRSIRKDAGQDVPEVEEDQGHRHRVSRRFGAVGDENAEETRGHEREKTHRDRFFRGHGDHFIRPLDEILVGQPHRPQLAPCEGVGQADVEREQIESHAERQDRQAFRDEEVHPGDRPREQILDGYPVEPPREPHGREDDQHELRDLESPIESVSEQLDRMIRAPQGLRLRVELRAQPLEEEDRGGDDGETQVEERL